MESGPRSQEKAEKAVAEDELLKSRSHPSYNTLVLILPGVEFPSPVRVGETLKGTAKG